jgi:SSS family solute:Na+ symporter
VFALGGPSSVLGNITAADPGLLDPTAAAGFQFGLALAFAILGAELLNQTWWQRIYAGTDSESIAVAFRRATVLNGLIVFIAAFLGVVAAGHTDIVTNPTSAAYNADVAFFVLLETAVPEWVILVVVLLALSLVMSSVDTLFNALSSLITVDLARIYPGSTDRQLRWIARGFTLCIAFAAIYVSVRAQSVLRLFFLADLLGTALAFPLVYGLYSERLTGFGALAGSLSGLAVGLAYFPDLRSFITAIPLVGPALPNADPLYLTAFGGSFLTSIGVTIVISRLTTTRFDLDTLSAEITRLDEPIADGGRTYSAESSLCPDGNSDD